MSTYLYSTHDASSLDPTVRDILGVFNIPPVDFYYDRTNVVPAGEIKLAKRGDKYYLLFKIQPQMYLDSLHWLWKNNKLSLVFIINN